MSRIKTVSFNPVKQLKKRVVKALFSCDKKFKKNSQSSPDVLPEFSNYRRINKIKRERKVIDKQKFENFGNCSNCHKPNTGKDWCNKCDVEALKNNFSSWTSGNSEIDKFLQFTQTNAKTQEEVLEWISYDEFSEIKVIGSGAYGSVKSAIWKRGHILKGMGHYDKSEQKFQRIGRGPQKIALKVLNAAKNDPKPDKFLKELNALYECLTVESRSLPCFGVTRDPTKAEYMIVMHFATHGDLRDYLRNHFLDFTWEKRFEMIFGLTKDLCTFHKAKLVHRDIHAGNILCDDFGFYIADLGLSQHINEQSNSSKTDIRGVLQYMAPETIRTGVHTTASDIYSFSMVMWEITSGLRPFFNASKGSHLALEICDGVRPEFTKDTPPLLRELIKSCWNVDPKNRPSAEKLDDIQTEWKTSYYEDSKVSSKTKSQITIELEIAEQNRILVHLLNELNSKIDRKLASSLISDHLRSELIPNDEEDLAI
ncbi:hypothetical protein G9A89_001728 [Geosiphon pyriformis]|nr:hypothetical protein G9A89_001728 [Geosiphon pyriformis]